MPARALLCLSKTSTAAKTRAKMHGGICRLFIYASVISHPHLQNAQNGNRPLFDPLQMASIMNDFCNMSVLVGFESLVKGATYRVLYARKCMSPQGIRLFLKLRTHPQDFRQTAQLLCRHSSNVANRQNQPASTFSQLFLLGQAA
jgi:hypothetical protein